MRANFNKIVYSGMILGHTIYVSLTTAPKKLFYKHIRAKPLILYYSVVKRLFYRWHTTYITFINVSVNLEFALFRGNAKLNIEFSYTILLRWRPLGAGLSFT